MTLVPLDGTFVAGVLGHKDTQMILHQYGHVTAKTQARRDVVNKVAGS